jgi:hypothetical protein
MGMKVPKGLCHECLAPAKPNSRYCPTHQRRSKYRSTRTEATIAGVTVHFDSRREEIVYAELSLQEKAGEIILLSRQPRFRLVVQGILVCTYVADAQYFSLVEDRMVVVDAKGVRTRAYRIKAKLFQALTGYPINEV